MNIKINEKTRSDIIAFTCSGILIIIAYFLIKNFPFFTAILGKFLKIILPLIIGFAIAFIFNPLMIRLENKVFRNFKRKRIWSAFTTIIIALVIIVLLVVILFPQIINSVVQLADQFLVDFPAELSHLQDFFIELGINQEYIESFFSSTSTQSIINGVIDFVKQYLPKIINASWGFIVLLGNIGVGIIMALYILLDKERFIRQVKQLNYALLPRKTADLLVETSREVAHIFNRYLVGTLMDACLVGITCYVGLTILSLLNIVDGQFILLISLIVGLTNMIPIFGPFIGAVPGVIIFLFIEPIQVVWFALFILVLQQIDGNIIYPKIMGDLVGLPNLWVMLTIIVGGGFFGILGMFLAVPIFALIYLFIKRLTERQLLKKGIIMEELE